MQLVRQRASIVTMISNSAEINACSTCENCLCGVGIFRVYEYLYYSVDNVILKALDMISRQIVINDLSTCTI